jgi:hypothetical protein
LGITNEEAGWQRSIENPRKQRKVAEFQAHPKLPQKKRGKHNHRVSYKVPVTDWKA